MVPRTGPMNIEKALAPPWGPVRPEVLSTSTELGTSRTPHELVNAALACGVPPPNPPPRLVVAEVGWGESFDAFLQSRVRYGSGTP